MSYEPRGELGWVSGDMSMSYAPSSAPRPSWAPPDKPGCKTCCADCAGLGDDEHETPKNYALYGILALGGLWLLSRGR